MPKCFLGGPYLKSFFVTHLGRAAVYFLTKKINKQLKTLKITFIFMSHDNQKAKGTIQKCYKTKLVFFLEYVFVFWLWRDIKVKKVLIFFVVMWVKVVLNVLCVGRFVNNTFFLNSKQHSWKALTMSNCVLKIVLNYLLIVLKTWNR